jgi:Spy/CpxP family protein refolding chaperone
MKANKTMLIAALAVGSLLVWGPALRAGDTNTPPSTPPAGAPPAGRPPGAGIEREAELLNLTADQKTKVEAIEKAEGQKMVDLRSDTSLTPKDRQAKRKAIAEELSQQMKAVLTPEQFDKWQKTSLMGTRRLHPGGPPPGNEKAGSTNAPVAPPKQ